MLGCDAMASAFKKVKKKLTGKGKGKLVYSPVIIQNLIGFV